MIETVMSDLTTDMVRSGFHQVQFDVEEDVIVVNLMRVGDIDLSGDDQFT
jgi:hypothetical protein